MNKKVGGIRPPSPPRLAPLQSATTSQDLLKPGTAINRHMALKPRRKMERVLTNDKLATQQAPPPLRRSATAPAVPGLKRESSEVSILEIPLKRAGVEKSKRYSQREVDLSAISHATELRLKKKAVVDEALRGAIATLKKPNRTLAVREFIDSVDHRVSGVGTGSRSE